MLSDDVKATVLEELDATRAKFTRTIELYAYLSPHGKITQGEVAILEKTQSRLAAIERAIAAINAEADWVPVADEDYIIDSLTLNVSCDGQELQQWRTLSVYKDGSPKGVQEITLGEFRLFQRIGSQSEAQDGKP